MRILVALEPDPARTPDAVAAPLGALAEHQLVILSGSGREAAQLALALRNELPDREVVTVLLQTVTAEDPDTVAAPEPHAIASLRSLRTLLDAGSLVVCATGCLAAAIDEVGGMRPFEAPIDRERTASLLARRLDAHLLGDRELRHSIAGV